jgi:hypothetical protein
MPDITYNYIYNGKQKTTVYHRPEQTPREQHMNSFNEAIKDFDFADCKN